MWPWPPRSALHPEVDRNLAPAAHRGDHPAPHWTLRRGAQNLAWVYASGLVFLLLAVFSVNEDDPSRGALALRVTLLLVIAVAYVLAAWVADAPLAFRWAYIGLFIALIAIRAFSDGWGFVGLGVYVSILLATLIPWRVAWIAIAVWSGLVAATFLFSRDLLSIYIAVVSLAIGWAAGGGIETGRVRGQLRRAEARVSTLSVAAERERISRDMHDILGHSLTAIAIKAGLAARLADRDPQAARAEMTEVEEIARQALTDVRATAAALRLVRLTTELAGARSVLMAAGIEAEVPTAVEPMPDEESELLGYVVREAVTNVVRHSQAHTCVITVAPKMVRIADDGVGRRPGLPAGGSGLHGLRERVAAAGGELDQEWPPSGGTVLTARLAGAMRREPSAPAAAVS
jgi:two-component system sensor histidine kinase DesK